MIDKPESLTAVLKIKLGKCLTGPTKRMAADLHAATQLFNAARNRMVRYWERYCEDHPEVIQLGKRPGDVLLKLPQGFSTQLYHAGRETSPKLNSIIVAQASNTILAAHILKRTPWNHQGQARRMWQAILGNEAARPCFRECGLAAPNKTTRLDYDDHHATLTFALWSKQAGRKQTQASCRIAIGRMPRGLKNIIRRVCLGENGWKLCDSEIVWKEGRRRGRGTWFFHMAYQRPPLAEQLRPDNVATLQSMDGTASHPFEVFKDLEFAWRLGDVNVLQAKYQQLETRRLVMRNRYRDAGSGRKGHGRKRIEAAIRPVSRQSRDLMERFAKNVVAQAVKYCRRHDCGALVFDRPRTRQKACGWFAAKEIPFDWTRFEAQLKHRCHLFGIRLLASADVVALGGVEKSPQSGKGKGGAAKVAKKPARVAKVRKVKGDSATHESANGQPAHV